MIIFFILDLKLSVLNDFSTLYVLLNTLSINLLNFFSMPHLGSLTWLNFKFVNNSSFFFALKFLVAIFFLILIRGGTPRYRYDYLTKLGWLKFLSFTLLIFCLSLLFVFIQ